MNTWYVFNDINPKYGHFGDNYEMLYIKARNMIVKWSLLWGIKYNEGIKLGFKGNENHFDKSDQTEPLCYTNNTFSIYNKHSNFCRPIFICLCR